MIHRWTSCDICNPHGLPAHKTYGKGVAEMPLDDAARNLGWGVRKGKHVCAECLEAIDAARFEKEKGIK